MPSLSRSSPSHRISSFAFSWPASSCPSVVTAKPYFLVRIQLGLWGWLPSLVYLHVQVEHWSDTVRHWSPTQMPSVQDGWCQALCWLASSYYLPIHVWDLNPHTPSSLCSSSLFLPTSLLPLASSSSEPPVLTPKEKMTESLPVIPFRKTVFWMALPQGMCHQLVPNSCTLRLPHAPTDMKWTLCSSLHGVKPAQVFWTVEKEKRPLLCWGTEFARKIFAELFWCHRCWDDTFTFLFEREKYCFHW